MTQYCIDCKKITEHTAYDEEDVIGYMGKQITFTDKGFICNVCGCTYTPPEEYDSMLQDIRDEYNRLRD